MGKHRKGYSVTYVGYERLQGLEGEFCQEFMSKSKPSKTERLAHDPDIVGSRRGHPLARLTDTSARSEVDRHLGQGEVDRHLCREEVERHL